MIFLMHKKRRRTHQGCHPKRNNQPEIWPRRTEIPRRAEMRSVGMTIRTIMSFRYDCRKHGSGYREATGIKP